MYSNQYRYGDLVDVLVSFEQDFDTAYATGIVTWQNGTAVETDKYMWHGLDRLNQITTAPGSLALIHGNAGNMALAIDQAISHGYTHVDTTDRVFQNNVWGRPGKLHDVRDRVRDGETINPAARAPPLWIQVALAYNPGFDFTIEDQNIMEAERINALSALLNDLTAREAELRRYL